MSFSTTLNAGLARLQAIQSILQANIGSLQQLMSNVGCWPQMAPQLSSSMVILGNPDVTKEIWCPTTYPILFSVFEGGSENPECFRGDFLFSGGQTDFNKLTEYFTQVTALIHPALTQADTNATLADVVAQALQRTQILACLEDWFNFGTLSYYINDTIVLTTTNMGAGPDYLTRCHIMEGSIQPYSRSYGGSQIAQGFSCIHYSYLNGTKPV